MGLFLTPNGSVRWKVKSWISGADSPAKARTAGGLLCLLHSDLPRPPCLWEPDQKNVGEEGESTGVAGPAPGRRRADILLLQIFLHHPGHTSTRLHSLPPSGWTDGNKRAGSRFQSTWASAGCFPYAHQYVYFPVYVERCGHVNPALRRGRSELELWREKVNFLRSRSAPTQADHFGMKLSASWEEPVVSRQWCTRSSRWGLNLFSTFIWFIIKIFKKLFKVMNEIATRPERVHLRRRLVLFPVRDLTVSPPPRFCSAGFQAPSACPVPSAEEVPRQTGSSSS